MGETVWEHDEIQGLVLRTLTFQHRIPDTEHGPPSLEEPTSHYGHAGHQPCPHPQQ